MVKLLTYCSIFLALAIWGCSPGIVDPAPISKGEAAEYFWQASLTEAAYVRHDLLTGNKTKITLQFQHDSTNSATVTGSTSNSSTEQFHYRITDNGIVLDNMLGAGSFIPLPEGFKLTDTTVKHFVTPRKVKKILVINSSQFVIADDENALFSTFDGGKTWLPASGDFYGSEITAIEHSRRSGEMYASTSNGFLFHSADGGQSWKRSPIIFNPIITSLATPLETDTGAALYAATKSATVYGIDSDTINIAGPLYTEVTALATVNALQGSYLAAGSSEGLWFTTLHKKSPWKQTKSVKCLGMVSANREKIFALVEDNSAIKLFVSTTGGESWTGTPVTSLDEYEPHFIAYSDGWLLLASERSTYFYDISNYSAHKLESPATEIFDLSAREGTFAIATDKGVFAIKPADVSWKSISGDGISDEVDSVLTIPGSLMLMKTDEHGLDSGNSWQAGMCQGKIQGVAANYYATAVVHEGLDSLVVGDKRYGDVIPISYIFSTVPNNTRTTDGTPYMVIYYARNMGPVLIEQFVGKNNRIARIYRTD